MTGIPEEANLVVLGVGGFMTFVIFGCIIYLVAYRCLCGMILCPKIIEGHGARPELVFDASLTTPIEKERLLGV